MIEIAEITCTTISNVVNQAISKAPRLFAMMRTAAQIARKSAATSDAPPISPPSMSGCANSSPAFAGFTLPP